RPLVEPELFASLRPQTYNEALEGWDKQAKERAAFAPPGGGPARAMKRLGAAEKDSMAESARRSLQPALRAGAMGGFGGRGAGLAAAGSTAGEPINAELGLAANFGAVASAATAANLGDFFQYVIDHPVSLPRQKSAMLPIVSTDVEGAKVSIYNERTLAKHP